MKPSIPICDILSCHNPVQYIRPCPAGCGVVHARCDAHYVITQLTARHYTGDIRCACGYSEPIEDFAKESEWTDITKKESK